jgi:hypothetical protein
MFTGIDAALTGGVMGVAGSIACTMVSAACEHVAGEHICLQYIDRKWPALGGAQMTWADDVDEQHLTDQQSFRRAVRRFVREAVAKTAGTVATRPFQGWCTVARAHTCLSSGNDPSNCSTH